MFLSVVAKRQDSDITGYLKTARTTIDNVLPVPRDTIDSAEWSGKHAAILAWSNEGQDGERPPLLAATEHSALGVSGTIARPNDVQRLARTDLLGAEACGLAGCFSAIRTADWEVQAATSSTRALSVFHAETDDVHVVGTRALHVHLVAGRGEITWNNTALQTMIRQGYFLSDETPYAGVTALGPSSSIVIRGGRRTIESTPLPEAHPAPASPRARRAAITRLADALVAAVEPLRANPTPVNLALTGGRDSRLMAALLHAAKVPFRATTNGLDSHPDVILARQITALLRIDHNVIPPVQTERRDAVLIPHPSTRTFEVLRTCEGMTSAYESIVEYLPYSARPTMSGQSGEILRGGFLYSQGQTTDKAMRRRVNDFFLKNESLFTEEANEHARELATPWLRRAEKNPWEVLDHLYVTYRVGRWHAAARAGSLRRGDPFQPFLDNRVVVEALSLDQRWRHSEEVVYELIRRFAPGLHKIEVEGKPWRFLANQPPPRRWPWSRPAIPSQKPTPTKKPGNNWNWRTSPGPNLSTILRDFVLERTDALSPIVRAEELKAVFEAPSVSQPALAWNLYTVAAMLTGAFPGEAPSSLEPVRVEIPRP
ncbi:hypothetical protein ACFFOP_02640 [Sinosporangium siamense]|uniref:hypothetical protein n=1 Tax=Sinosporangium siamense TaxID=1367973 RepID=UPI0035EC379B